MLRRLSMLHTSSQLHTTEVVPPATGVAAQPADGAAPRRLKKGAKKGGGEKAARKPLEAAPSTSAPANAPDAAPPAQEKDAPWRRVERPPK